MLFYLPTLKELLAKITAGIRGVHSCYSSTAGIEPLDVWTSVGILDMGNPGPGSCRSTFSRKVKHKVKILSSVAAINTSAALGMGESMGIRVLSRKINGLPKTRTTGESSIFLFTGKSFIISHVLNQSPCFKYGSLWEIILFLCLNIEHDWHHQKSSKASV